MQFDDDVKTEIAGPTTETFKILITTLGEVFRVCVYQALIHPLHHTVSMPIEKTLERRNGRNRIKIFSCIVMLLSLMKNLILT